MKTLERSPSDVKVMYHVPYRFYVHLTNAGENRHLKMAYHDGTLEIVSPRLRQHAEPSVKFRWIITALCRHWKIPFHCSAGTTFRRHGGGVYQGVGKEADESYYIANLDRLPRDRDPDLDAGDPAPDLWMEVDNRASSQGKLPVYAALGVAEVWRYRARTKVLRFLRLTEGAYMPIAQSVSLPGLTPALVLEALALGDHPFDSIYLELLEDWIRRTFPID